MRNNIWINKLDKPPYLGLIHIFPFPFLPLLFFLLSFSLNFLSFLLSSFNLFRWLSQDLFPLEVVCGFKFYWQMNPTPINHHLCWSSVRSYVEVRLSNLVLHFVPSSLFLPIACQANTPFHSNLSYPVFLYFLLICPYHFSSELCLDHSLLILPWAFLFLECSLQYFH